MDLPFDIPERTEFTDDGYGVLGRALAVATEYEGNCRALASVLGLKSQPRLLDYEEIFREFCNSVWRKFLKANIETIIDILNIREEEVISKLHIGREARNYVAHESAVGAPRILEVDSERKLLIEDLSKKVRELAEANLIVNVISQLVTHEPIPTVNYLRAYPDKVVEWVCEVEP